MKRLIILLLALVVFAGAATACDPSLDANIAIRALRDENKDVRLRVAAAETLGRIGPEVGVVRALTQTLEDANADLRVAVAEALGQIGPEAAEAVPALIQALEDESGEVRQAAACALEAITGQDFGPDAARWQQWWEEQQ